MNSFSIPSASLSGEGLSFPRVGSENFTSVVGTAMSHLRKISPTTQESSTIAGNAKTLKEAFSNYAKTKAAAVRRSAASCLLQLGEESTGGGLLFLIFFGLGAPFVVLGLLLNGLGHLALIFDDSKERENTAIEEERKLDAEIDKLSPEMKTGFNMLKNGISIEMEKLNKHYFEWSRLEKLDKFSKETEFRLTPDEMKSSEKWINAIIERRYLSQIEDIVKRSSQ